MAKRRRKSNKPNLPDDVLARARRNAGIEDAETSATDTDSDSADDSSSDSSDGSISVTERAARRRKVGTVQLERSRKRGELTNEMISDVLHNPTKVVTEDDLRQDYQHVIYDLRNMAILAAILVVIMMIVAFSLPTF